MAMSVVPRSKFAAIHRQWWCLHISKKFSSGTKNPKHTNNHTNKQKQTNKQTNERTNERTKNERTNKWTNEQRYFKGKCTMRVIIFFTDNHVFINILHVFIRMFGCSIIYKEIRHWFRVMSKCLLVSTRVSTEWPLIQHWRTTWTKRTKKRRVFWIWPNFLYQSHNVNFFQDSQAKSTMMIYFKRFKNKRIRWRVNM